MTAPVVIDPLEYHGTRVFDWVDCPSPGLYQVTTPLKIVLPEYFRGVCGEHESTGYVGFGALHISSGFVFDGASGPAITGVTNMLASMIHDALYAMASRRARRLADRLYFEVMVAQGGGWFRSWLHWLAVRGFGWAWAKGKWFLVACLLLASGCAYQTSRWDDPGSGFTYRQTNITPPFGKQAESAGHMTAKVLKDGTWELAIGRVDRGVDNSDQVRVISNVALGILMKWASGGLIP